MKNILIKLVLIILITFQVISKQNINSAKSEKIQGIESLLFSTFLGGSVVDEITDMFVDASGNIYVCGYTSSSNFPTKPGCYDESFNGTVDAFVCKFNSNGTQLLNSTFLGGELDDRAISIDVDGSGNVYIAGYTSSSGFPTTTGVVGETLAGEFDCFVAAFNSTLSNLLYSTYIGGSYYDEAKSIRIDGSGNAYVCGKTYSTDFPVTSGAFSESHSGEQDIVVFKINSSGTSLIYSTYLGGSDIDVGHEIDIDASGNAYILGETQSTNFPTIAGSYDLSFNGDVDVTVTKINSSGSGLLFSTFLGGSEVDRGHGLTLDNSNNIIICGETQSSNFPTTSGVIDRIHNGGSDAFVTMLNPSGASVSASTLIGGGSDDKLTKVVADNQQNLYLSGSTTSVDFPITANGILQTNAGAKDAIYCKINPTLSVLIYSTYFGGYTNDEANSVDIDGSGIGYIAGNTMSPNLPTTNGVFDGSHNGQSDGFVAKIEIPTIPTISISAFGVEFCAGETLNISYTVSSNFNSGNIFTVQLSDSLGNFTNPINIGNITATGDGSISVLFPKNLSNGTLYQIRISASNPSTFSLKSSTFVINALPNVQILGEQEPCIGVEYIYSCYLLTGAEYSWAITGGQFESDSTSSSVKVIWTNPGNATLKLIKKIVPTGCSDTNTIQLTPHSAPPASIISGQKNVCLADVIEYYAGQSTTAITDWEIMGGVALEGTNAAKAVVLWTQQGEGYVVIKKTSEFGCIGTDTMFVKVNPVPFAQILGQTTVIENKFSKLWSDSLAGAGNKWTVTGGIIQGDSENDTINVLWGNKGVARVTLIKYYYESRCSDTTEQFITINADFPEGYISGKDSVCESSLLEYSTNNIPNTAIKWYVKNGSIIGADNANFIRVSWQTIGTGEVKYIITDLSNGNQDSAKKVVNIFAKPIVTLGKFQDYCSNSAPVLLNSGTPSGGRYSGNGVEDDYFYPDRAGVGKHTITYDYTDINGCKGSDFQEVTVYQTPEKPIITINESEHRIYSSYEFGNQWFIDDVEIEGETNQWVEISAKGKYSCQYTDPATKCKSEMSDYLILGIKEDNSGFNIYPNPADDKLYIQCSKLNRLYRVDIIDIFGRTVYSQNFQDFNENLSHLINLSEFNNGIYIIKLYFSNRILSEKLIINK